MSSGLQVFFVKISEMKLDDFYHQGFLNYCLNLYCYFHNISSDMSSGLLQVFFVKISEMKLDDFYHQGFLDYCLNLYCYFHNISSDMSSGLLQVFFVKISDMKLDDFYHQGFLDYCLNLYCYFYNVSADMSSDLLQVFVEVSNLHGSFIESTGVACCYSVSHNRVKVLSILVSLLACSQNWTCNLQMIVSLEA